LCQRLTDTWAKRDQHARHSFLKACLRTYITSFALVTIPRLCSIAFILAQPLLVNVTLSLINQPDADNDYGKGLIGAWALVYVGISIRPFPASFLLPFHPPMIYAGLRVTDMYQNTRFVNELRGGLTAFVYQQSLKTRTAELGDITAVALMGTDVQRIVDGMGAFHQRGPRC